jgi:PPK2 family polyphosphate:nucleotide phosphotransferase
MGQTGEAVSSRIIDAPRTVTLADYDPSDTGGITHGEAKAQLPALEERIRRLQDLLYGAARQAVLIILQGMDTSGKDGTVRHVMSLVNPTSCQVWDFKQPTPVELTHDFLWRVHKLTPAKGVLAIFNRSHYEDVLVVRVHHLVPQAVWEQRYAQINNFERMLTQNGTVILKFFLHISKDEQKQRLLDREKDVDKAWKLSLGDWEERAYWDAYQQAYADVLGRCGTAWAPWQIVPANHKWYRNYVVARAIVERLEPLAHPWSDDLERHGRQTLEQIHDAHAHQAYG